MGEQTKKFYHELTDDEVDALIKERITYGELRERHPEPVWCGYGEEAVAGLMGCWSLVFHRTETNEDYCKNCDLYIPQEKRSGHGHD